MDPGDDVRRAYRRPVPEWSRQLAPAFALITLVTAILAYLNDRPWSAGVALIWFGWAALLTWPPVMTRITSSGVRVRRGLRWRFIPWSQVSGVTLAGRWGDSAGVRLADGEVVPLRGVTPELCGALAQYPAAEPSQKE